jgi:hypothetical protein
MPYNPDKYLTSAFRELKAYVLAQLGLSGAVLDPYEVIMSYPDSQTVADKMPLTKTLIHFDIDDETRMFLGLGDNVLDTVINEGDETIEEWEAGLHEIVLNVGVWASVQSGGVSARLEARQDLDRMFNGPDARKRLMAASDGIEILSFTGGMFVNDLINDMPVFRVVDMALRLRVFSRYKKVPIAYIDDVGQQPEIIIDGNVNVTG